MLTKEHLKFRTRAGKLSPIFVDAKDEALLKQADDLIVLFRTSEGMRVGELEETADALAQGPIGAALTKLLFDGCDEEDDDGKAMELRWQVLKAADQMRRAGAHATLASFQLELAAKLAELHPELGASAALSEQLYADLPARRKVTGFKETTPDALLMRYNVAQVQGLLIQARAVEVRIKDSRLPERRELFRQLKFHRLMAEVIDPGVDDRMAFRIGGPLSIFDQQAGYGLRLANFFPHLLHLERWEIEAEVKAKGGKNATLKVDQKSGLHSHYKQRTPYIPAELTAFVAQFNERAKPWGAAPGDEFVHLGHESYCFPDLTISGQNGRKFHVELFHRWHAGQLLGRLQALDKSKDSQLLIGVSKPLLKNPAVDEALKASGHFAKAGFLFSEFPTPKALLAVLERA